jgi:beta-glucosidase
VGKRRDLAAAGQPTPGHRAGRASKAARVARVAAIAIVIALLAAGMQAAQSASASTSIRSLLAKSQLALCPWLNESLPIARRVRMVLAAMTVSDKINMVVGQYHPPYEFYMAPQPSLCIPALAMNDGSGGVGHHLKGVTQLPAPVSLAATFDPSLAMQYGQVIGAEERGKGVSVALAPSVDIDRDPRWGRSFETFSEDPLLSGAMGVAEIDGIQSQGVMAQVKHFAVYNQETYRSTDADDAIVSERALHEIYLPPFEQAVTNGHVASVMCAYSQVNGRYSCQDPYLLNTILDRRWGFQGFVSSDLGGWHSSYAAVLGGTDMDMPGNPATARQINRGVQNAGSGFTAALNEMVSRVLTEMFRFGLFNHPPTGSLGSVVTTAAHQALGQEVAEDGTVLLKNTGNTLPLSASGAGTIAVIGQAATAPVDSGDGSSYVIPPFTTTPLQGIRAGARTGTQVVYSAGLPAASSLPAIPDSALSPHYVSGRSPYTGTLTAPETGTYVLAAAHTCRCAAITHLSLNGRRLLADPTVLPSVYSVAVHLRAGHRYALSVTGPFSALTWATPSDLAPYIDSAVQTAKTASTAVVVVADNTESENADRPTLQLPSAQDELIEAVAAANPRTVVVIDAGAPVLMPWLPKVAAVVDAWYPGESNGSALAAVLYGQVDPSGHLPVTFPASLSQVPAATQAQFPGTNRQIHYSEGLLVGYRWYDQKKITPLFPFGYGLSYTHFAFSQLQVNPDKVVNPASRPAPASCRCNQQDATLVRASVRITNTGPVAGADVVQLYVGDPADAGEPPRQLEGFQRVYLAPHQSATVRFRLTGHELSYWNDTRNGWVLPTGTFHLYIGDSSALANLPEQGSFSIAKSKGIPVIYRLTAVILAGLVLAVGGITQIRRRRSRQRARQLYLAGQQFPLRGQAAHRVRLVEQPLFDRQVDDHNGSDQV